MTIDAVFVMVVLGLIAAHWIADFVLQSHWMASNKSKRLDALGIHVLIYSVVMTPAVCHALLYTQAFRYMASMEPMRFALEVGLTAFIYLFVLHFATDHITSRISSKLYAEGDYHNFFVVIGFDQFLHYVQIFSLLWLFQM